MSETKPRGFTPIELRIMNLLSDGEPHSREELRLLLHDELATFENVKCHIVNIRKKLPEGCIILAQNLRRQNFFRYVRHIHAKFGSTNL